MLRYFTSLAFSLITVLSFGQGSIAGTVTDAKSKDVVIGANVIVVGTTKGASTDIDGKFVISNLDAGTYTLQISYLAYKTNTVADVIVKDATRVTLEVPLQEESTELGEVIVTSGRVYDTDYELLRAIKEMKLVVVGVTAEQIGKTLDRDAAQVLRRVPGITINDGQFVQIRGLSSRYNPVLLHNAYAPSVETDVRSFSFASLPSSQLDRILVFKSASADIPGDFAGGVVKVFTKGVPEDDGLIFDYSTQIRAGTTFKDFYHQDRNPGYNTGFNTGFYGLPSGFPSVVPNSTGDDVVQLGRSLRNDWVPTKSKAIPDQRFALTYNKKFKIGKVDVGSITALNYSNSFATYNVDRGDFNEDGSIAQLSGYRDKQYNQTVRTGFLFNWSFKFSPTSIIEFKNMFNQSSADQYVDRLGTGISVGEKNGSFDKNYRGIYSGQLVGTHDIMGGRTTVEWVAGYNNTNRTQPDLRRFRSLLDGNGGAQINIPSNVNPNFLGRFYSAVKETAYSGGASIRHRFGNGDPTRSPELKIGGFFENKDRSFHARSLGYSKSNATTFNNDLAYLPIDQLFQPQNINNVDGIKLREVSDPKNNYTASNNLLAYYITGSLPIGQKIKIDAGARMEDNLQKLNSTDNSNLHVTRLLPSANMSYNFSEKMLVRAAYGQTLNRPEFRELAPFSFYDFNFNFVNTGKVDLKTATIQNLDLRWELYPSKTEMITFGVFYKNFKDPIEQILDNSGNKGLTFANAEKAQSIGVEMEIKKSLTGLTGSALLNNINVMFNGALINSKVTLQQGNLTVGRSASRPMQGQAPYVMNAGVFYSSVASGWQVNALYNVVGKSIVFVGNDAYKDVYLMPRNVVDLTFSKQLGTRVKVKGGISDILNQPMQLLQDGNNDKKWDRKNDQTISKFKPGQVFSIGFSLSLGKAFAPNSNGRTNY